MHTLQLLHSVIPEAEREPLPCAPVEGVCAVTGAFGPAVPRADLLGKSFTDQHLLRDPSSPLVGEAAWCALKFKWERMSSWLCTDSEFQRLDRKGVRDLVIGGVQASRWAGYITTSYKKHGALRAPLNSGRRQVWLFEMRLVDCTDRARLLDWWRVMNEAIRRGISRQSQEMLDMPPALIRKIGVGEWEAYRAWARDKWQSAMYALLVYLLPSQEELRAEAAAAAPVVETKPEPLPERPVVWMTEPLVGNQLEMF